MIRKNVSTKWGGIFRIFWGKINDSNKNDQTIEKMRYLISAASSSQGVETQVAGFGGVAERV